MSEACLSILFCLILSSHSPLSFGLPSSPYLPSMPAFSSLLAVLATVSAITASPYERSGAFTKAKRRRELEPYTSNGLTVDLGYEVYEGYNDENTGLDTWLG